MEEEKRMINKRKRRQMIQQYFDWICTPSSQKTKMKKEEPALEEEKLRAFRSGSSLWLPDEIYELIVAQLSSPSDFIRFGGVCRRWRSIRLSHPSPPRFASPWLIYYDKYSRGHVNDYVVYSIDTGKHRVELRRVRGMHLRASSHGWLVFANSATGAPRFLLNPVTRACIELPQFTGSVVVASPAVLSSPPAANSNCVVAFRAYDKIVFCRIGDCDWSTVDAGAPDCRHRFRHGHSRMAACGGKIYFLIESRFGVLDPNADPPSLSWLLSEQPFLVPSSPIYPNRFLVESEGEVLQAVAIVHPPVLHIYKPNLGTRAWEEARESISNRVLFVGQGCSFSAPADSLAASGCVAGSVYVTFPAACESPFFEKRMTNSGEEIYKARNAEIFSVPVAEEALWWMPSF